MRNALMVVAVLFGLQTPQAFESQASASTAQLKESKSSAAISADDILKRTDEVRCPMNSYYMEVEVHSKGGDDVVKLEVFTKGREKTRINTLLPVRDKGRNMVMIGEEMWAYVPNLKRAVRVALNQKLSGQASNGDVSRMRWWGDYSATVESEDARFWVLVLSARKKGLTYDKIRAWVEKGSFRPSKAEYLSLSGLVLKRSQFGQFKRIAGEVRPTEIRIEDAKNAEDSSVLRILNIEERESSDALFNQNALR
ncbi:MAG: outer membrane lipoprotein-sorting protein [Betaproteobacteria bacterium]|nr:outer membrane lipoprotein-sorting protein [Betaproteobacteria bacterium]